MKPLIDRVTESIDNTKENGYTFDKWTAEEMAMDLAYYGADIEHEDINDIIKAVNIYLNKDLQ